METRKEAFEGQSRISISSIKLLINAKWLRFVEFSFEISFQLMANHSDGVAAD